MAAPKLPKRPDPFEVGPIKVRPVRGPHKDDPKSWYWRAVRYRDGEEVTLWTAWAQRAAAQERAARSLADGDLEPVPRAARSTVDPRRATVSELLDAWREEQRTRAGLDESWKPLPGGRPNLARNTAINYRNQCKALTSILGAVRLEELSPRTLSRYREARRAQGRKPLVIHYEVQTLSYAWTWGREMGLAPARDFPKLRRPDDDPTDQHTPTPGELSAVLAHLDGWTRLCAVLLEATGARIAEIGALCWEDLDREAGEAILGRHADARKTGERRVPLHPGVWTALEAWAGEPATGPILGLGVASVRCKFTIHLKRACKAADAAVFTAKGYRRLMSRRLMQASTDPKVYEEIMGHSYGVGLRWYRTEVGSLDRRAALERAGVGDLPAGEVIEGPWKISG